MVRTVQLLKKQVDVWENNFCNWSAIANKCSWNTSNGDLGSVPLLKN